MNWEWDNTLRVVNAFGCFISLWLLAWAAREQWKQWNAKTQAHWWALSGWVFFGLEGAIENIVQNNPPGPRTILQTLVVAWTLRALAMRDKLSAGPTLPWKERKDDDE